MDPQLDLVLQANRNYSTIDIPFVCGYILDQKMQTCRSGAGVKNSPKSVYKVYHRRVDKSLN